MLLYNKIALHKTFNGKHNIVRLLTNIQQYLALMNDLYFFFLFWLGLYLYDFSIRENIDCVKIQVRSFTFIFSA